MRARPAQGAYENQRQHPRGRPPGFAQRIACALSDLVEAERQRDRACTRQAQARASVRELSAAYHPFDLQTGQAQPPERVAQRFHACWQRLHQVVEEADLPARARRQIDKAQGVTTQLLATIAFFFATVQAKIEALNFPPEIEAAVHRQLLPAIYLERVAERSTNAEQRQQLRVRSAEILIPLRQPDHCLSQLTAAERACLEQVAGECADLFQRSSSCVEGRNGQLSLHHHGRHRLSNRKLAALTAIHNYFIRRPDGTTAAERFFGRPPPLRCSSNC